MLLAAGIWMMAVPASVSAQTSGADAVKMLDTDNDGTVDLDECKAAAATMFDKLDADKSATLDQGELGDRGTITIVESPHNRMFFETRPSKADYIGFVVKRFDIVDPDHEGTLDATEFESEDGQLLVKLLQ
jgi:Ca2+-binding EF-hand superfamily protein